jgi:hypothetical protein
MEAAEGVQFDTYNALGTFFWAFQFQSWDDFLLFVNVRQIAGYRQVASVFRGHAPIELTFVITSAKGRLKVKPLAVLCAVLTEITSEANMIYYEN